MFRSGLALLLAAAGTVAALGSGPQRIFLRIQNSPVYAAGKDVEVGRVTLRRAFSRLPSLGGTYAKAEIWFAPASLDVCALPEFWDAPPPRPSGDDEFVLMLQVITDGSKKVAYDKTPVAQALFSDTWPDFHGKPVVLIAGSPTAIKERFKGEPIAIQRSLADAPEEAIAPKDRKDLNFRTFEGFTLLRPFTAVQSHLFHQSGKDGRYDNWGNLGLVMITGGASGPRVTYDSQDAAKGKVALRFDVGIDRVCAEPIEERKFWGNGRVMK